MYVRVSAPHAFGFCTETLHIISCLLSEVLAVLFHSLTAGNSNKENSEETASTYRKKTRFILKGRKNSTSSMVPYVPSPLPTLSVKQHVVQPGRVEISARMSERVSPMIP